MCTVNELQASSSQTALTEAPHVAAVAQRIEKVAMRPNSPGETMFHKPSKSQAPSPSLVEDDPLIVLGVNLTPLNSRLQFYICACGVFAFTIVYGYLQELLSVHIMGRKYALFLSLCQLAGYSFWSFILMNLGKYRKKEVLSRIRRLKEEQEDGARGDMIAFDWNDQPKPNAFDQQLYGVSSDLSKGQTQPPSERSIQDTEAPSDTSFESDAELYMNSDFSSTANMYHVAEDDVNLPKEASSDIDVEPPIIVYLALSCLRAMDIGLTNGAMRFLNYPAKTLIKSSRVAFTMFGGMIVGKKKYRMIEYLMVTMLVFGLSIFLHADYKSKAVFHPIGVLILSLSLCFDSLFNNYSELIMRKHRISQDEYQSSIYTMAFIIVLFATIAKGEFIPGAVKFFLEDGTIDEIEENKIGLYHHHREFPTYTKNRKLFVFALFTFTGLIGSSCAGAITKRFGALNMSVTSTTRKAGTLFISLAAPGLQNDCTAEHILGMIVFISALFLKSCQKPRKNNSLAKEEVISLISTSPSMKLHEKV